MVGFKGYVPNLGTSMHQHGRSTNPTSQPLPLPASGRTVYRGIPRHPAGRCHGSGAGAARFPLAEASGLRRVLVGPHFPSRSRSCGLCGSNRSPSVRARFPRRAPPHSGCGRKRGGFAYERCLRQLLGPCDASRGFRATCFHGTDEASVVPVAASRDSRNSRCQLLG